MRHRRPFLIALLLALWLPAAALAQPMAAGFREGLDYVVLKQPLAPVRKGDRKLEVVEVFNYACIHCFHFQPLVNKYKAGMAKDARWEYVPAPMGGPFDLMARAFIAAQLLGVDQKTHDAVFEGIFVQNKVKQATPDAIADLYAGLGVDRARFMETLRSPVVQQRFDQSRAYLVAAGVQGTPTLIVNGKYRVLGREDAGPEGMFRTVDFLLAKERAAAKAGPAKPAAPKPPAPKPAG